MSVRQSNPDVGTVGGDDHLKSLLDYNGKIINKDHRHRTVINAPLISQQEAQFRIDATNQIQSYVNEVDTTDDDKWNDWMQSIYLKLHFEAINLWTKLFEPDPDAIPSPQEARDLRWRLVFLYTNLEDWAKMLYHPYTMDNHRKKIVIQDNGKITTPAIVAAIKEKGRLQYMTPGLRPGATYPNRWPEGNFSPGGRHEMPAPRRFKLGPANQPRIWFET